MPQGDEQPFGVRTRTAIIIAISLFCAESVLLVVVRHDDTLAILSWQLSNALNAILWVYLLMRRFRRSAHLKAHWALAAAGFGMSGVGDCFDFVSRFLLHNDTSLYVLSGRDLLHLSTYIPFFLLVSLPAGRRHFRSFVWMDFTQTVIAIVALYALLFHTLPFDRISLEGESAGFVVRLFEITDACVVIGLLLHYFAAKDLDEKRFYRFFLITMVIASMTMTINNEVSLRFPDQIFTNILMYLESLGRIFLYMYLLPVEEPTPKQEKASGWFADIINIGSPVISSAALLALGVTVQPFQAGLGLTAIVAAFAIFAMRSTVYLRNFEQSQMLLENAWGRLEQLSYTDELTGAANRRGFDLGLKLEWQRSLRSGSPLSLILLDVDYFKQLNDGSGHQAGDACLSTIARVLRAALPRSIDVLGRYGGDEFAVILPSTDALSAEIIAARLCDTIRALAIVNPAAETGHVTISLGVGTCALFVEEHPTGLLGAADAALYAAKAAGRNGWRSATVDPAHPHKGGKFIESVRPIAPATPLPKAAHP